VRCSSSQTTVAKGTDNFPTTTGEVKGIWATSRNDGTGDGGLATEAPTIESGVGRSSARSTSAEGKVYELAGHRLPCCFVGTNLSYLALDAQTAYIYSFIGVSIPAREA
jgi:hypothetical protein